MEKKEKYLAAFLTFGLIACLVILGVQIAQKDRDLQLIMEARQKDLDLIEQFRVENEELQKKANNLHLEANVARYLANNPDISNTIRFRVNSLQNTMRDLDRLEGTSTEWGRSIRVNAMRKRFEDPRWIIFGDTMTTETKEKSK